MTLSHTEHAARLAAKLEAVLALNMFVEGGEHLIEVAEARAALAEWAETGGIDEWQRAGNASASLGVSEKTLKRWRDSQKITPGIHWRRINAGSHCLYHVPRLAARMDEMTAAGLQ